ncbi:hypothetical protein EV174_005733, partial [Coemansia sp. RSA 2320]
MGNTQSADGDGGGARRHSSHHGAANDNASPAANSSQSGGGGGGLSHRLSRRSKPAAATVSTATPIPAIQVPTGTNGSGAQKLPINHSRHPPGVGHVDMQLPVVGSPLPDSSLIPGYGNMAAGRPDGRGGVAHMAVPEAIPQTLPNQGGLAQMMAARNIGPGAGGRSPLTGISDDRIRGIAEGTVGVAGRLHGRRTSGLATSFIPGDDDDDSEVAKAAPTLIRWTEPGGT